MDHETNINEDRDTDEEDELEIPAFLRRQKKLMVFEKINECHYFYRKKTLHYPVLLNEVINIITPQNGGTFIDCTFGQGGYSKKILEYPNTKVIAIDRDKNSQYIASKFKKKFEDRFSFHNIKFSQIKDLNPKGEIKGIIFDLGYSLSQIKDLSTGLSFDSKGELNMKMGLNDFSAKDVINKLDQKELEQIFKYFGEEKKIQNLYPKKLYLSDKKKFRYSGFGKYS